MNPTLDAFVAELVKIGQDPIQSALKTTTGAPPPEPTPPPEKRRSAAQTAAVGAAAAAPFAGMVGQQPLIHDPVLNKRIRRFDKIDELARVAQPGDIIITSKPGKGAWKLFQAPLSGSEFYHAQPVVGRRGGRGLTASAGNWADKWYKQLTRADFIDQVETIGSEMKELKYKDVLLMRPKKGMSAKELETFVRQSLDRVRTPYDMDKAMSAYLRDIFVPKVKMVAPDQLKKAPGVTTIQYRSIKNTDKSSPSYGKKVRMPVMCKGNVCSTVATQAFSAATGKGVVPGKLPQDVLPGDIMRSKEYKPVGAVVSRPMKAGRIRPLVARGAIGAGLAGATYAATEDPALVAGVGGAAAGSAAAKRYYEAQAKKKGIKAKRIKFGPEVRDYPSTKRFIDEMMNAESKAERSKALRRFATKNLPAKVVGGTLAYIAARHLLGKRKKQPAAPKPPTASS